MTVLTGNIVRLIRSRTGGKVEGQFVGEIKTRLNRRKKAELGPISKDKDALARHYTWVKNLESEIGASKEVPSWLL